MLKQNIALLLNRYIWLIDTINSASYITREEIDRRWSRSLLSEGETTIPECMDIKRNIVNNNKNIL